MAAKPSPRKKYGAEPRRQPKPPVPGWIWLLTGCALGAFIMFLMHLSDLPVKPTVAKGAEGASANSSDNGRAGETAKGEAAKAASGKSAPSEVASQKPRYDFYRLLKENQTPLPPRVESPSTGATPAMNMEASEGGYILQVASYKTATDADQLRAKLILLNLDAKVETVTLRNADVWHRVLIGPLKNQNDLTKARAILSDNKYEALVLKNTKDL